MGALFFFFNFLHPPSDLIHQQSPAEEIFVRCLAACTTKIFQSKNKAIMVKFDTPKIVTL